MFVMGRVKLRDAEKEVVEVERVVRQELYALKCVECGMVFASDFGPPGTTPFEIHGIFDCCPRDENDRGLTNMFSARVCSFACAHKFLMGGWKKCEGSKPYVDAHAIIQRVSLTMVFPLITETELIERWIAGGAYPGGRG